MSVRRWLLLGSAGYLLIVVSRAQDARGRVWGSVRGTAWDGRLLESPYCPDGRRRERAGPSTPRPPGAAHSRIEPSSPEMFPTARTPWGSGFSISRALPPPR